MSDPIRMVSVPVDELAQEIRRVDGNHSLGAGALAEALLPFLSRFTAAPVREEGGAVDGPEDDELPGDFLARVGMDGALWADGFRKMALKLGYSDMDEGWLIGWFCNAVMAGYDHAQRRFDPALATREEAPAEAGDTDRIGTHSPSCWSFGPRHYECALAEINRLRAQPQSREETQPVAWRARMKPDGEWMVLDAKYVPSRSADSAVEVQPLYTTPPAPEAEKLRVAVEALTALAGEEGDAGEKVYVPCAWVPFREVARQALAALQAEQKGGA